MGSLGDHHRKAFDKSSDVPADMPIINYAKLLDSSRGKRKDEFEKLDKSLRTYGFFYLSDHSISQDLVDEAFRWSKRFFDLPVEIKEKVAHPASGAIEDHRGWAQDGLGHVSQLVFDADQVKQLRVTSPECKETLEMGNPHPNSFSPPNRTLPDDDLPGFNSFVEQWWDECTRLERSLLHILGQVLQLEDDTLLCQLQSKDVCHISWAFYPSMPIAPLTNNMQRRLNAHTDFGSLTLLFQDMVGGLEVHDGNDFKPVVPKRGTVVCNVGDMLERQTNGRWKSALHQVAAPKEVMIQKSFEPNKSVVDRYSIIYFGLADPEAMIESFPGCEESGKWKPTMVGDWDERMTSAQWLQKRLALEY
ncbi:hypothetical protein JX265_008352 [Neoarthrinium moseri]|uniref:Fe2OG dioxygenase domain-containing protein n=1 Tax=Neoarthrinium moseri TaxID=1658444 RepID=A0A9Q0AK40_9PEZI|nr:hypothetical protein JX265_008352 [Neoarthrinium moseri]